MQKGNILIALGAVVLIICFFLPWVSSAVSPTATLKFSGQELAVGPKAGGQQIAAAKSGLWVTFACGIACLVLVAGAFMRVLKSRLGSLVAVALAVVGVVVLLVNLMGGPAGTKILIWLIVTVIAEVVILAGGAWNLLGKKA